MNTQPYQDILFLDIETVAQYSSYQEVPEQLRILWEKKSAFFKKIEEQSAEDLYRKAGIYAEFGKVIVIAVGYLVKHQKGLELRIKSLANDSEKIVLEEFVDVLNHFDSKRLKLCAHNGKEFDFPYLSRRMLVHNLKLPAVLNHAGKKPWQVPYIDTMELWKFGDYKHFTSLELLAALFQIKTSKSDIDGSMVNEVYHSEKNLDRIKRYCQEDIRVLAEVYLKLAQNIHLDLYKTTYVE